MEYTDVHRSVLRTFVRKIAIDEASLLKIVRESVEACPGAEPITSKKDLDMFIASINKKLTDYNMHLNLIKKVALHLDGKVYWVLVNVMKDDISRAFASGLKDNQLIAFREILGMLVKSLYGNLLLTEIKFKEAAQFDKKETKQLVQKLVEQKWLAWDPVVKGKFTAGVRTLAELGEDLRDLGASVCERTGDTILRTKTYIDYLKSTGQYNPDDQTPSDSDDDRGAENKDEAQANVVETKRGRKSKRALTQSDDDDDDEEEQRHKSRRKSRR